MFGTRATRIRLAASLAGLLLSVPVSPAQNVRPGPLFGTTDDRPQDADLTGRGFDDNRIEVPKRLLLAGRVILEDGNPLPESLNVELACGGSVRQETHTYGDEGRFSFELGGSEGAISRTGTGSDTFDPFSRIPGERQDAQRFDLSGCMIRTALEGFRANTIPLGVRSYMDSSDVGMIILRRLEHVGGSTVSFNTLAAPKKAQKAYREADLELKKQQGDVQKAIRHLKKAIELYPEFAAAWYLLGRCHHALRDRETARKHFQKGGRRRSQVSAALHVSGHDGGPGRVLGGSGPQLRPRHRPESAYHAGPVLQRRRQPATGPAGPGPEGGHGGPGERLQEVPRRKPLRPRSHPGPEKGLHRRRPGVPELHRPQIGRQGFPGNSNRGWPPGSSKA